MNDGNGDSIRCGMDRMVLKRKEKTLKMAQVILDNLTNSKASTQSKMDSELVSRGDNIKQSHRLNPCWVS
jgi:hypothetical protein